MDYKNVNDIVDPGIDDIPLSSCCIKDAEEKQKYSRIINLLDANDITKKAMERRHIGLNKSSDCCDHIDITNIQKEINDKQKETYININEKESSLSDSDDEYFDNDDFFQQYEKEKIQKIIKIQNEIKILGFGMVHTINLINFYNIIKSIDVSYETKQLEDKIPKVALILSSYDISYIYKNNNLLHFFSDLSKKYYGTKFYICNNNNISITNEKMKDFYQLIELLNKGISSLCSFKNGNIINILELKNIQTTQYENIALDWLEKCHILEEILPENIKTQLLRMKSTLKNQIPEVEKETESENIFDCGNTTCNARFDYYHEHIGPTKSALIK